MGYKIDSPEFLMIDLFCGAGGTTTGAEMSGVCKVIAAINHDPLAIKSHAENHQDVMHMEEDILVADITQLIQCVREWKQIYPNAKLILWASLECTNFSNAKGGLPRDADSRSLANGMFRYIKALDPDYFLIENVKEFMSWGELDENGKPESKTEGRDYIRWIKQIQSFGYNHDWRLLNAANFGGVTIRERFFGAFWKPNQSFSWPQRTHAKRASKGDMFQDEMKPWRAVSEVLDFTDIGTSIFDRPRPLVDKTLRRILAGLRKFHTKPQIMTCNSPGYCVPAERPIGAITTVNNTALITPFMYQYNGQSIGRSLNDPCATVTIESKLYLATPILAGYYGNGNCTSIEQPCPTIPTHDRFAMVTPWIDRQFRSGRYASVSEPSGALLTVPKMSLCCAFLVPSNFDNKPRSINVPAPTIVASRKHISIASSFIVNPQYKNKGNSIHQPAPTVIAKQRSYPLSLASSTPDGIPRWTESETDTPGMNELKQFMKQNGIADIYMRMLKVIELKRIQGFPDNYILKGPLNEQKKFIGNSVETGVVSAWLRSMANLSPLNSLKS
jgi:DNA (cytosine-5)-methyltransferase 1